MAAPHLTDPIAIQAEKRALRHIMLARRLEARGDAAGLIAAILAALDLAAVPDIAGIWPLAGEPDLRPLWSELHRRGHRILLPETTPRGSALVFRPWSPGAAMVAGRHGTWHPACRPDARLLPGLIFVPLLAFDGFGYRLGYGGGYYDRTLAALPGARAVGYGFSSQQVERVPRGPFDLNLPMIVTENGPVAITR